MSGDEGYINKFPEDAAEIAALIKNADMPEAVALLQIWGSKQRDIGGLKVIEMLNKRSSVSTRSAS